MPPPARRKPVDREPPRPGAVRQFLVAHRAGLAALVVVLGAAGGGYAAWQSFAGRVAAQPDTVLHPGAIELRALPPGAAAGEGAGRGQPTWISGDIKSEALRDASLDGGLPLDDPELARRLARAFDMHPWVKQVVSVQLRHPAAAIVEVRCREPVAMVEVPGGVYAVDAEGTVLPSGDFTPAVADAYPRVTGIRSLPLGAAGAAWGDPLVEEAAAIAAVIGPEWSGLGLDALRPVAGAKGRWELVGQGGRAIVFGAAPGRESSGEPRAAAKLGRLRQLGDGLATVQRIDLTEPAADDADKAAAAGEPPPQP